MPLRRLPTVLLPALAFVALSVPACVDPGASAPVLEQQADALRRLERASAEDSAALATLADSLLAAQRERALVRLELVRLDDPAFIEDATRRRDELEQLPEIRELDSGAGAIRAALRSRAIAQAALFAETLADNAALSNAAGATIDLTAASREAASHLWREAVLERIDDPAARDAAARLLDNLLNPSN